MAKKQKQAKQEAKVVLQLAQSRKDVRKAQRKILNAQGQLAASRARLRRLEAKIAELRATLSPIDQEKSGMSPVQQNTSPIAVHNPDAIINQDDRTTSLPSIEDTADTTARSRKKDAATPEYGLYAYGVVEQSLWPPDMLGIDQENEVYAVTGRGISVIVSKVNPDQFQERVRRLFAELTQGEGAISAGAGEILQAHEAVIEAIMQNSIILPLKFGTILKDESAALTMLQEHEGEFKDLLVKLDGKVECGLKVYADRQALRKYMLQDKPERVALEGEQEQLSKGAAYLLRRKNEEEMKDQVAARLAQLCERIFQALGQDAAEARLSDTLPHKMMGKKKEMVLNAVYLVEKEKVPQMYQKVKNLTEEYARMGIELESSGPWPPYNFTRIGNEQ